MIKLFSLSFAVFISDRGLRCSSYIRLGFRRSKLQINLRYVPEENFTFTDRISENLIAKIICSKRITCSHTNGLSY